MDLISVLVVEDNPSDATLISEFLAEESPGQFRVEVVNSLADAVIALTEKVVDIVLLDLSLPDSTGLNTVRKLVGRFPEVAIIVLTGLNDAKMAVQSVRFGAQDYLEKKYISSMWLGRAIRYAIERKRIMRQQKALLSDLSAALEEIEMLQKIVPICSNCKKIRNNNGEWETVEYYLKNQIGADFSHSLCPSCTKLFYPEASENIKK